MKILLLAALLVLFGQAERSSALNIVLEYIGGTPPTNSIGGGSLTNIMTVAAAYWTNIIRDNFVVTIPYGWTNDNLIATGHTLDAQGGTPPRETEGTIWFLDDNIPGHLMYYLDPTPAQNEEYTNYVDQSTNLGGGSLICGRYFSGAPVGPTGQCVDLKTVAIYEIGHALGLSKINQAFQSATSGGDSIVITAPRPFAGTVVPIRSNNSGPMGNIDYISDFRILMGGSFAPGERVLPSQLDIATIAQISGFTNVNYGLMETGSQMPNLRISTQCVPVQSTITALLSWNCPLFGTYGIEQCSCLGQTNWIPVQATITETNGVYSATVPTIGSTGFFRLKQQLP